MVRFLIILVASVGLSAGAAQAQSYARCAGYQVATVQQVLPGAHDLALNAAVAVGDTPEFRRWFGAYTPENSETVRANLKRIYKAIADERLRFYCGHRDEPACQQNTYAYVYPTEPYAMTLCPAFFTLPRMENGSPNDDAYEYGTMEGTIIHEISHFEVVAGTEDHCYGRTECSELALERDYWAIRNADTYQYYTEDVVFALEAAANR